MKEPTLESFQRLACGPEERIRLDRAALEIARVAYPRLDAKRWTGVLDELAARTGRLRDAQDGPLGMVGVLNRSLFQVEDFHGDHSSYYSPRSSFLNDVLTRRTGIPIALSVVYMEVARRLGVAVDGIGFPGHFLVRTTLDGRDLLLDPFHRGQVVTLADCQQRLDRAFGVGVRLDSRFLEPAGPRDIVARMLRNLKRIYVSRKDLPRALAVVERLRLVLPDDSAELRDGGKLRLALGEADRGAADLEEYLAREPGADDEAEVRLLLRNVRRRQALVN